MPKMTDHCEVLGKLADLHPEYREALSVASSALLFIENRKLETALALEIASLTGNEGEPDEVMLERQRAAARAVLGVKK